MSYSKATTVSPERLLPLPSRRLVAWGASAVFLLACAAAIALLMSRPHPDSRMAYPRIQGAGGVLPVGPQAAMPSATREHRIYIDLDSDTVRHGQINARLHTAAKLLNLYALAGVPADKVKMVVLFYGRGVNVALSDEAFRHKFGHANPNAGLIEKLRKAHVKMMVCGQAMGHQDFVAADIRPGLGLALSALTAREELQAEGYGPVPAEVH